MNKVLESVNSLLEIYTLRVDAGWGSYEEMADMIWDDHPEEQDNYYEKKPGSLLPFLIIRFAYIKCHLLEPVITESFKRTSILQLNRIESSENLLTEIPKDSYDEIIEIRDELLEEMDSKKIKPETDTPSFSYQGLQNQIEEFVKNQDFSKSDPVDISYEFIRHFINMLKSENLSNNVTYYVCLMECMVNENQFFGDIVDKAMEQLMDFKLEFIKDEQYLEEDKSDIMERIAKLKEIYLS